jgi:histidinol dehydrogenase
MRLYKYPEVATWQKISARPSLPPKELIVLMEEIFSSVEKYGDAAVAEYAGRFDGWQPEKFEIDAETLHKLADAIDQPTKQAIDQAYRNIKKFHQAAYPKQFSVSTLTGVRCRQEVKAIEKVGLYVPGGNAPLVSTVLMLGVPAQIAQCRQVAVCTPIRQFEGIRPSMAYALLKVGATQVFGIGGAQAIAAMSLGTETVPKVDKIFGPGNQYVTAAKIFAQAIGTSIDMTAGPSEVMVIADDYAKPEYVAADLLSQAEHGPDSQVVLVSNSENNVKAVRRELIRQLKALPRRQLAEKSLASSRMVVLNDIEECLAFANTYAPEHLILNFKNAEKFARMVQNAGSVFIGDYSPESAGDYASGTNHTLPTNGTAKSCSGIGVDDFVKRVFFQTLTPEGLNTLSDTIIRLAEEEGLYAHANAVSVRLGKK